MATFSDGQFFSSSSNGLKDSVSSVVSTGDMRQHLQNLLDTKDRQVQQVATLGERVLQQRMELEEKIYQLRDLDVDRGDSEDINGETRLRYHDLASMLKSWEDENVHLAGTLGIESAPNGANQDSLKQDLVHDDVGLASPLVGPTAAQSSRRARNAAHRANDVEFAFEIGSSLLTEVRRLQSLLGERDKAIQDMKEEKDDLDKGIENLRSALRTQEQNADKYKEENWNLEVTLQDLRTQLADAQSTAQRGESESKRLTKQLAQARDVGDTYKTENEKLQITIDDFKAKHETDVAYHRKQMASMAREKSDLQQNLDNLKAEATRASKRLPRFGSPLTPNNGTANGKDDPGSAAPGGDEDDLFTVGGASTNRRRQDTSMLFPPDAFGSDYADSSPEPSPSRTFLAPNHPKNEIEALQQKLAHTQRQLSTMKGTLMREKEMRMEYKRKLAVHGINVGSDEEDFDEATEVVEEEDEPTKPKLRNGVVRGRGRGRGRGATSARPGRMTLAQKLGMASLTPSSDKNDDDDDEFTDEDIPRFDESQDLDEQASPTKYPPDSPSPPPSQQQLSHRTSVDGMDPAFANVLKSSPGVPNPSPLRQILAKSQARQSTIGSRRRGGAAFQERRPSSLVGQPEALAVELGIGMESVTEDQPPEVDSVEPELEQELELEVVNPPIKETVEFGCQVDFVLPPPPPIPIPILITPETAETATQTDAEPVVIVPTAEMTIQTEQTSYKEASIATDPLAGPPITVDTAVETDKAVPVPTSEVTVQTLEVTMSDIHTQTVPLKTSVSEFGTQTDVSMNTEVKDGAALTISSGNDRPRSRRSTLTRGNYASLRNFGNTTKVRARLPTRLEGDETDDGETTETGLETETDPEEYQDARQSIVATPTPSGSLDDFHSMSTLSDNDYMEDESSDEESIKASQLSSRVVLAEADTTLRDTAAPSEIPVAASAAPEKLLVTYGEQAVSTDSLPQEPVPEPPKKEVAEMSIQTDEWTPPALPVTIPSSPQAPSLYRVGKGSYNQQFQFISGPSTPQSTVASPGSAAQSPNTSSVRDSSTSTIGPMPRGLRFPTSSLTSQADRRRSIDSTISSLDEHLARSQTHSTGSGSGVPTVVDKTRPPTMILPPPPRAPPPPGSMPPPAFIPERKRPGSSMSSHERDVPPLRPTSPPPAELIQRATTPNFGHVLTVPGGGRLTPAGTIRQHGSLPPMNSSLRQLPSTTSFRSAANAAAHAHANQFNSVRSRGVRSTASLSDQEDATSRRSSLSSADQFHHQKRLGSDALSSEATAAGTQTPQKAVNGVLPSTDPAIIHAITQTMIGEFLYKYTRKPIGKGYGDRRHKRFFWVHPYTKTLYWSSADPGSSSVSESSAKSAYIDGVRAVLDPNPLPPGLHQYSVVISTPQREMKFTAPTKERHEIWLNALQYLLARPAPVPAASPGNALTSPEMTRRQPGAPAMHTNFSASPKSQRSAASGESTWQITTPRGQRSQSQLSVTRSFGKRSGTPAAEYLRWADGPESPSLRSPGGFGFEHVPGPGADDDDDDLDFEIHDSIVHDEGFEGLENVRACCDGRHTVGRSGNHHHHHHHHHHQHDKGHDDTNEISGLAPILPEVRPSSPAFSFRSKASSQSKQSHEGGGGVAGLFSRFGSRSRSRQGHYA